jgi:uncharacterized membrane protein YhaH (DUF805 family)
VSVFEPYKRYFDFQGRASRREYWMFYLLFVIVTVVTTVLVGVLGRDNPISMVVYSLFGLFILGSLIPSVAVTVRRLHDTNRSGWWLLISFLPFIGGLVLLVFTVLPGTPGENRYGRSPLSPQQLQETFA